MFTCVAGTGLRPNPWNVKEEEEDPSNISSYQTLKIIQTEIQNHQNYPRLMTTATY